ncbi:RNA polymerase sigma factor, partial [Staphylococcus hominis]|uniref:RNA polymerase sigma factor n=1 Tax=Staphylococcus hominis TaxID=1290 RepID=UPI00273992BE
MTPLSSVLLQSMAISNEQEFEKLFTDWFGGLHAYAFSLMKDDVEAEEVVQTVFCRLWERREKLPEASSPKAYLYGCVYHACVDQLRRRKTERAKGDAGESPGEHRSGSYPT